MFKNGEFKPALVNKLAQVLARGNWDHDDATFRRWIDMTSIIEQLGDSHSNVTTS